MIDYIKIEVSDLPCALYRPLVPLNDSRIVLRIVNLLHNILSIYPLHSPDVDSFMSINNWTIIKYVVLILEFRLLEIKNAHV